MFSYSASVAGALAFAESARAARDAAIQQRPEIAPYPASNRRALVAIVRGDDRRRNVHDALVAIDDQILPVLKRKKYVILKPNGVNADRPSDCTDADALRGALEYLAPRFKGPIVIAESAAYRASWDSFDSLGYPELAREYRAQKISLSDINEEPGYEVMNVLDPDFHLIPVRIASRMLDPNAYMINLPKAKWHSLCVATLAVKNVVLAAPLRSSRKEPKTWTDKWKLHPNFRHAGYNMMLVAQKLQPHWGATVIDAFKGMEAGGGVVDHRIAVASTDYVAADRVMLEAMGIDPGIVGYLVYCGQAGIGQYDLARIDVKGVAINDVRKKYNLPKDMDRMLEWMHPMTEVPKPIKP
jgi:uncharacterized protein (DUF362 family)